MVEFSRFDLHSSEEFAKNVQKLPFHFIVQQISTFWKGIEKWVKNRLCYCVIKSFEESLFSFFIEFSPIAVFNISFVFWPLLSILFIFFIRKSEWNVVSSHSIKQEFLVYFILRIFEEHFANHIPKTVSNYSISMLHFKYNVPIIQNLLAIWETLTHIFLLFISVIKKKNSITLTLWGTTFLGNLEYGWS